MKIKSNRVRSHIGTKFMAPKIVSHFHILASFLWFLRCSNDFVSLSLFPLLAFCCINEILLYPLSSTHYFYLKIVLFLIWRYIFSFATYLYSVYFSFRLNKSTVKKETFFNVGLSFKYIFSLWYNKCNKEVALSFLRYIFLQPTTIVINHYMRTRSMSNQGRVKL